LPVLKNPDKRVEHFNLIYKDHYANVAAYAIRRTKTREDAADVIAETFTVAWRHVGSIPHGDAELLWLYGVARRVLANQRRSSLRQARLIEKIALDLPASPIDREPSSSESVVRSVLRRLSSGDQELLALTHWEDLSPKEISVVLGITSGAARVRLLRARRRFKEELEKRIRGGELAESSQPVSGTRSFPTEVIGEV
jgi:RNA polymerase sigma-70 factor (ECF subfamily)